MEIIFNITVTVLIALSATAIGLTSFTMARQASEIQQLKSEVMHCQVELTSEMTGP